MWDNASIHRTQEVKTELEKLGIPAIQIPPYSPWFNGVELLWASCKVEYRRQLTEYKLGFHSFNNDGIVRAIIAQHSQEQINKWLRNAWKKLFENEP